MTQLVPTSDLASPTYNLSWLASDLSTPLCNIINKGEPFWNGLFIHGSKNKLGFGLTFSGTVTTAQIRLSLATTWPAAGQLKISAIRLYNQSMTEIMNWVGDYAIDDQFPNPRILDFRLAGSGGTVTALNLVIEFVAGTSSGPMIYGINTYINEYCYGYDSTYGFERRLPTGDRSYDHPSWSSTGANLYSQVAKNIPGASTGTYIELASASGTGPYYGYHIKFDLGDLNYLPRLCTVRLFAKVTGGTATVQAFSIGQGISDEIFYTSDAAASIPSSNGEVAIPMYNSVAPFGKKEWWVDLYFVCQPSVVVRIYAVQIDLSNEENEDFTDSAELKTLRDPTSTVNATETNCGYGLMFSVWNGSTNCVAYPSFVPSGMIRLSIPVDQGTLIKQANITLTAHQALSYYGYLWCFKDATADAHWPTDLTDFDTLIANPHGFLGGDHTFNATGDHTFVVDITDSVQAAVNQSGWVNGDHINLIFEADQDFHQFTINAGTVSLAIDIPQNNGLGTPSTITDYLVDGLNNCYLGNVSYTDLYRILCQFYINQYQGSTVDKAYLNVYSDSGYSAMNIRVYGVKKENCYWPGPGGSSPGNATMALALFSNLTTAYADVSSDGSGGMLQFDVTSIVQELVDQQGWEYENLAMFVIVSMTGNAEQLLDNTQGISGPHLRVWAHGGHDRAQVSQDAGSYAITSLIPNTLQDWVNNGLTNLELGYEDGTHQYQGLIWVPLYCPQGHLIDDALLFMMLSSGDFSFTVQAVAQDDPSWPASAAAADALPLGTQSVTFYNNGYSDPIISEYDITSVVQEVVNRPGFVFGNHILLKIIYIVAGGNHRSYKTQGTETLGPFLVLNLNYPIPGTPTGNVGATLLVQLAEHRKHLFFN